MKIIEVAHHDHYCTVVFARDGQQQRKHVRLGNEMEVFISDMKRAAREADRDISMILHNDITHCEDRISCEKCTRADGCVKGACQHGLL